MKLYRYGLNTAASLAGLAAITGAAQAAPVDYGAFEDLFNEPVTASATGAPQRATEAPVNMTIITQEDIQRSGATDLPGVLERLASVDVMRFFSGHAEVGVRGYDQPASPRLLVLVNGRQVYLDHYGMTNWDAIPVQLAEIRQIEVVAGPNTALFGFNAVGGVVNILTYDVLNDDVDNVALTYGSNEYRRGSATLTARLNERAGVRISVGGINADSTDADRHFAAGADDPRTRTAAINGAFQLADHVRADLEATYGLDQDRQLSTGGRTTGNDLETSSLKAAVSIETGIGVFDAQVYRNYMDLAIDTIAFDNQITVGSLALLTKPAAAHTLRFAIEGRDNELEVQGDYTIGYKVLSGSGMWSWQINDALALTSAVRVDALALEREGPMVAGYTLTNEDFDREFTEYSYNIGAVYRLSPNDSLRASVARGVQAPSLAEFGFLSAFAPMVIAGDPEIEPTIVQNYELGWDHTLPAIHGRFRASVYHQTNEDLKGLQARFAFPLIAADNIGESDLTGLDLGLEGVRGKLHWDAQLSVRDVNDDVTVPETGPAPPAVAWGQEHRTPENIATLGATWVEGAWEVGADARYVSATEQYVASGPSLNILNLTPIDAHTQINARAAWRFTEDAMLELIGKNLFDDEIDTTGAAALERAFYVRLSANF